MKIMWTQNVVSIHLKLKADCGQAKAVDLNAVKCL